MKNSKFFVLIIILLAVLGQLYLFSQKTIFHIDEIFSYSLANNEKGVYLYNDSSEIDNKAIEGKVFSDYLVQTENSSFSKMWNNLKYDNHMPLYFTLLRFCSSFFEPVFSMIPGIIVNVLILILFLAGFYKLAKLFLDERTTIFAIIFCASFQFILSLEIYIRMYLLWMCIAVWMTYFVMDLLKDYNKENKKLLNIYITTVLFLLTHYFSFVFCFVLFGLTSLSFLKRREYKVLGKLLIIGILAILTAYLIYPSMLDVGTSGERGGQAFGLLANLVRNPFNVLSKQVPLFWNVFFNNDVIFYNVLFYMVVIYFVLNFLYEKDFVFLFFVFIGYGILSSFIQPYMINYQLRYFAPIIPIGVLLIFYMFNTIKKDAVRKSIYFLIVFINIFIAISKKDNFFYFRGNNESKKLEKIVHNADIWWGMGGYQYAWMLHNFVDRLAFADNVWILSDYDNKDFIEFSNKEVQQHKYAYLLMPKIQETMPEGAIYWIEMTTGRKAYYLFTVKSEKTAAMAFESSIFLVCPF